MNLVFSGRNAASQEDVESPPQEHFRTLREPGSQHLSSINHIRRVGVQRFISWILFHFTIKRRSERFDRRLFPGFPKTAKNPPTNSLAHRSLCGLSKKPCSRMSSVPRGRPCLIAKHLRPLVEQVPGWGTHSQETGPERVQPAIVKRAFVAGPPEWKRDCL